MKCVIWLGLDDSLKTSVGGRDYAIIVDAEGANAAFAFAIAALALCRAVCFPVKDECVD